MHEFASAILCNGERLFEKGAVVCKHATSIVSEGNVDGAGQGSHVNHTGDRVGIRGGIVQGVG